MSLVAGSEILTTHPCKCTCGFWSRLSEVSSSAFIPLASLQQSLDFPSPGSIQFRYTHRTREFSRLRRSLFLSPLLVRLCCEVAILSVCRVPHTGGKLEIWTAQDCAEKKYAYASFDIRYSSRSSSEALDIWSCVGCLRLDEIELRNMGVDRQRWGENAPSEPRPTSDAGTSHIAESHPQSLAGGLSLLISDVFRCVYTWEHQPLSSLSCRLSRRQPRRT